MMIIVFFFFSSRRRHTRSDRDWSSDVCSSDLEVADTVGVEGDPVVAEEHLAGDLGVDGVGVVEKWRSEEGEAGVEEKPEGDEDEAVSLDGRFSGGDFGLHQETRFGLRGLSAEFT